MAVLNIRNLPEEVHRKLRVRAAGKGRSMEAEARAILAATCETESPVRSAIHLQRMVDKLYGGKRPKSAVDALIKERRAEASRE